MKETIFTAKMRQMPALRHSIPGQPFDPDSSEVYRWLAQQPEVLHMALQKAKDRHAVAYDAATGCWSGIPLETGD